jgi:hypothetical protein
VAVEFILHCAEVGVTVRLAPSGRKVELVSKNGQAPPSVLITQLRIVKTEVVDYLRRRVQAEREARAMLPYAVTDAGMVWRHGDSSTALCNFTALITGTVLDDDGTQDLSRQYEITCALGGLTHTVQVSAAQFASMAWVPTTLGPQAIIEPGFGMQDRLRAAIQHLSHGISERHRYTHTGWHKIGGVWMYLHAGGAISADGVVPEIEVRLHPALANYRLPPPPAGREAVARAVRASLAMLQVATETVTFPVLVQTYRASIRATASSTGLVGESDAGKSCTVALGIQHYGPAMDWEHFPASWFDSDNAISDLQFMLKDAPLGIDDFNPRGSRSDVARMHGRANRVLRGQANRQGRQRMRRDATLTGKRNPRGSVLWTGESLVQGLSLQMRTITMTLRHGMVDKTILTRCQQDADAGLYAAAMAAFIQWQAGRYEILQARWRDEVPVLRDQVAGPFRRTTTIIADLLWGWKIALEFMVEQAGFTPDEQRQLWERACAAYRTVGSDQIEVLKESEPAERSLAMLSAAVASGKAHLTDLDTNRQPDQAIIYGWRLHESESEDDDGRRFTRTEWREHGDHVGYVDAAGEIYLEPATAYAAVVRLAEAEGNALSLSLLEWKKRLNEHRLLAEIGGDEKRIEVRRQVAEKRRRVLHIAKSAWGLETPDASQQQPHTEEGIIPELGQLGQSGDSPDFTTRSAGPRGFNENPVLGKREVVENQADPPIGPAGPDLNNSTPATESCGATPEPPPESKWRGAGAFLAWAAKAGVQVTVLNGRVVVFGDREPWHTEARRHAPELRAMLQRPPCHTCKGTTWWVATAGGVFCPQCTPPHDAQLVAMTFETVDGS